MSDIVFTLDADCNVHLHIDDMDFKIYLQDCYVRHRYGEKLVEGTFFGIREPETKDLIEWIK
jgi:hypothetical protein